MFKNYRVVVALLLFCAGMLNYLDRAALSVMAPLVKKDLGIDDAQMGILFSCFFIGYCLFCFLGGWGADRFGPRRVYAWAASIWSLFCGATALVTGFGHLLIVRMLFGIGQCRTTAGRSNCRTHCGFGGPEFWLAYRLYCDCRAGLYLGRQLAAAVPR